MTNVNRCEKCGHTWPFDGSHRSPFPSQRGTNPCFKCGWVSSQQRYQQDEAHSGIRPPAYEPAQPRADGPCKTHDPAFPVDIKESLQNTARRGFVGALAGLNCFIGGVIGSAIGVPVVLLGMFTVDDFPWFPVYFGIIVVCGLIGLFSVLGSAVSESESPQVASNDGNSDHTVPVGSIFIWALDSMGDHQVHIGSIWAADIESAFHLIRETQLPIREHEITRVRRDNDEMNGRLVELDNDRKEWSWTVVDALAFQELGACMGRRASPFVAYASSDNACYGPAVVRSDSLAKAASIFIREEQLWLQTDDLAAEAADKRFDQGGDGASFVGTCAALDHVQEGSGDELDRGCNVRLTVCPLVLKRHPQTFDVLKWEHRVSDVVGQRRHSPASEGTRSRKGSSLEGSRPKYEPTWEWGDMYEDPNDPDYSNPDPEIAGWEHHTDSD